MWGHGIDAGSSLMGGRVARWAVIAGGALLAGAGLGFLARDLLGLGQPAVALAWLAGVTVALGAELGRGRARE
jgi:hypothetical protein